MQRLETQNHKYKMKWACKYVFLGCLQYESTLVLLRVREVINKTLLQGIHANVQMIDFSFTTTLAGFHLYILHYIEMSFL